MGRARRLRYRHLRRTVLALLAFTAVAAGVVAGAGRVLASPALHRWLAPRVAAVAGRALGGEVRIGAVRPRVWPPELELEGVVLEVRGLRVVCARLTLGLAGTRIRPGSVELGSLEVTRAEVSVAGPPPGAPPRRRWVRVGVRRLAVEGLAVEGRRLPGGLAVTARDVRLAWTGDGTGVRGFTRAARVELAAPGLRPVRVAAAARFAAAEEGLSLERVRLAGPGLALRGRARLEPGRVTARARGRVDLRWVDRLVGAGAGLGGTAEVEVDLDGARPRPLEVAVAAPTLEVAGFRFSGVEGRLELGTDGLSATLDRAGAWGGTLSGGYRLDRLAPPWPHAVRVSGTGVGLERFLGDLGVPSAGLSGAADVEAELVWRGRGVGAGRGAATAVLRPREEGLPVAGTLRVHLAGDGMLRFTGEALSLGSHAVSWSGPLTLGDWVPSWSVTARGGELAELVPVVNAWIGSPVLPAGLSGRGDLEVELAGPWRALRVGVRLDASPLALGTLGADRVLAELEVTPGVVRLLSVVARLGEGGATASGTVRWGEGPAGLALRLSGRDLPLEVLAGWAGLPPVVGGRLAFSGTLAGPVTRPHGGFALGLVEVTAAGLPLGDGTAALELHEGAFVLRSCRMDRGLEVGGRWEVSSGRLRARARWAGMDPAELDTAAGRLLGVRCDLEARLEVGEAGLRTLEVALAGEGVRGRAEAGPSGGRARLAVEGVGEARVELERDADGGLAGGGQVRVVSAAELLRRLLGGGPPPVEGAVEAPVEVSWPSGGRPEVVVRPRAAVLEVAGHRARIAAGAVVTVDGGVSVRGLVVETAPGRARVELALAPDGSLEGRVEGTLDAALLAPLAPGWAPVGELEAAVRVGGTAAAPELVGTVGVRRGGFRIAGGLPVTGLEGVARLDGRRVEVTDATLGLMGGRLTARGSVDLEGEGRLALSGEAEGVRFEPLPGLHLVLAGRWRLTGTPAAPVLGGELRVDRGTLSRREDLAGVLAAWFGPSAGPEGPLPELPRLELHLTADRSIEASTPFLHLTASADLEVRGTPAAPGLVGTVELAEGGDLLLRGVRYEVERASLVFTDPERIWPRIEVRARTWVDIYAITVTLLGTPDRLVPTLVSDPPLETADVLSLLSLGRREEHGGGLGATLASTILTRQLNAELERRASSILAVDQLRVDPFTEGSTGNPTARLTVVKQLGPSWTVVFQTNLSSNREEVVVSRWYLERGLYLEAMRDADGSYSLDLKLRRRY